MNQPEKNLAYRIIKWDERHSNAAQKTSGGKWICCPTSFDSIGLSSLLANNKKGVEAFGVYVLIAELAGRMPTPGVLANGEGPLSEASIAKVTGVSIKVLGSALTLLQSPSLRWIDRVPSPSILRASSGTNPESVGNPSDRAPARAPGLIDDLHAHSSSIINPLRAWEQRAGRDATAAELSWLQKLTLQLEGSPLVVEGEVQNADAVLVAAIGTLPPDVRIPQRYIATVIDQARADGCMPGVASQRGNGGPASDPNVEARRVSARLAKVKVPEYGK